MLSKARKPLFIVGRGAYDTGAHDAISRWPIMSAQRW